MPAKLIVFQTRLTDQDIQALRDRAKVENSKPTVLARQAIRDYLSQKPAML
ncbi:MULTISPECIES: hypothetical protein [Trichocoleus]|uniref:Ribbon-helix-helix protein CopG domain-containing protein n=1 Tax=Trichocoleus desertorum GB2-A4 TaxID=2933944 RepID=A0ABV0JFL1_9CYAN|nr:hypothetical protein [Trichocoleus sp. FACHB-46]MBD1864884.1 hypothetical protein [Trichocoleus sp. FACHB-46]